MSKSPSRTVASLPVAALMFAILLLAIGILLSSTNTMFSGSSSVRAQFTPDKLTFKADDGSGLQFYYPLGYILQTGDIQSRFINYTVSSTSDPNINIRIIFGATQKINSSSPLGTSPADFIKSVPLSSQNTPVPQPAQMGGFQGATSHETMTLSDAQGNPGSHQDREIWVASLDPNNLLIVSVIVDTTKLPIAEPVINQIVNTIQINPAGAIKVVTDEFGPSIPPTSPAKPTAQPTMNATQPAS